jgi:hypothetical protein
MKITLTAVNYDTKPDRRQYRTAMVCPPAHCVVKIILNRNLPRRHARPFLKKDNDGSWAKAGVKYAILCHNSYLDAAWPV